ncbi:MAG: alkylmercury lyase family protein [Kiloniellaceae bacterium]
MTTPRASKTPAPGAPAKRIEISIRPGVTTPDWSVVTSETVREALEATFETCDWESRWAGLDDAQDRTRRAVLDAYALSGHAPSITELAAATGMVPENMRAVLGKLKARDMIVLEADDATITGSYPFTERDTGHRIHLGDRVLNAMCAIDALGAGAMYGRDVRIESACRFCGDAIRIETRDNGCVLKAFTPESAVVWSGVAYADGCAATSLCTVMAFFCSDDHLHSWRTAEHSGGMGFRLSIEEGLQAGKAIFMPLLMPSPANS